MSKKVKLDVSKVIYTGSGFQSTITPKKITKKHREFNKVHFSSEKDDWETPNDFFQAIEKLFGKFELDVCATFNTNKADTYFGYDTHDFVDGLKNNWCSYQMPYLGMPPISDNPLCWMNPPYGRGITGKWVDKAIKESQKGARVVCLLPSRTDTKWFKACMLNASEIYFVQGRLKFVGAKDSAPFPSVIVVFGDNKEDQKIGMMTNKGKIIL